MNQSIAVSHLQLEDATCIELLTNIIQVQAKDKVKVLFAGTVLFSGAFRRLFHYILYVPHAVEIVLEIP